MAKKRKAKTAKPEAPARITIAYDLYDLPTAQHKAGLAGLLLQIESMKNRKKAAPSYHWDNEQPSTKVHVEFMAETTQSLFDDAYDAEVVPAWFRQKKTKEQLKDERVREIAGARIKEFLYDTVQPKLPTLRHLLGGGPSASAWTDIWRRMLWAVSRGVNTTRIPFEVVAGWDRRRKKEDGRRVKSHPYPNGTSAWSALAEFANGGSADVQAVTVKGDLWLGAQERTAEALAFLGRPDQNLLLHFWHFASLVFVPQSLKIDFKQGKYDVKRRRDGFALAIPDIADLAVFTERLRETLDELGRAEMPQFGDPQSALIEIPAEGALSLFDRDRAAGIVRQKTMSTEFRYSIAAVDYLHFRPAKNGAKMLSAGRIELRPHLTEDYEIIAGRPGAKPPYRNSLFRRALLLALLGSEDDEAWFTPFATLFSEWPAEFFVSSEKSPRRLSWFWADASKKLKEIKGKMMTANINADEVHPSTEDVLANAVNGIVRRFLDERLKKDSGYDFPRYRKVKSTPPDAAESRRKLAERLFFEFRSRRDQAFVSHFSGTFFSVGQYPGTKQSKLLELVANRLMYNTEDVKTLTLMALSANSWVPLKKKENAP